MRKSELAQRLARQAHLSPAEAADQLDKVVHDILTRVREGKQAALPGLGRFTPAGPKLAFLKNKPKRGA